MSTRRNVFVGTGALTLGNAATRALALVTMPLLTRLLSPSAYGSAALVGSVVSLVSVVALAGMDMSYARAYHGREEPSGQRVEHLIWRLGVGTALGVALVSAIAWYLLASAKWKLPGGLAWVIFLGISTSALSTLAQAHARLRGNYGRLSVVLLLSGLLSAGTSCGVAAFWRRDEIALLAGQLVAYLTPTVLLGFAALPYLPKRSGVPTAQAWAVVKVGLAGIVTAPVYWLVTSSDRWFLARYQSTREVGIYSLGYSVGIMGAMLNSAISAVWLPEAAKLHGSDSPATRAHAGELSLQIGCLLLVGWLAVVAAGGDLVRWLAGPAFRSADAYVPWIATGVLGNGWLQIGNASLILSKRLYLAAWVWVGVGVTCFLLNYILVPRFGGIGAAVTQSASFSIAATGIWYFSHKHYPIGLAWRRLLLGLAVGIAGALVIVRPWSIIPWKSLVLKLPLGVAIAAFYMRLALPRLSFAAARRFVDEHWRAR